MKRFLRRVGVLAVVFAAFTIIRVSACSTTDAARFSYLSERIERHQLPGLAPGHPFDGEWTLITLSSASVSAMNLALREPQAREARARDVSDWARLLTSPEVRAYDTKQWGRDPLTTLNSEDGHAGYLGHVVLAMDIACLLGGDRDEALHDELVEALARRIQNAPRGLIETYPGETYVPDNVVVMAAIAQYDACIGAPRHRPLIDAWLSTLRAQWLDEDNGVLVFAPGQKARGSGAAWNSYYLHLIDEPFAAEQSDRMWSTFGDTALGGWLGGIREWPHGVEGGEDVDSGPLVFGISASATGYALADAVLRERPEAAAILRNAELTGVTVGGRYLFSPLVGDAITLSSRTMTKWPGAKVLDARDTRAPKCSRTAAR